MLEIKKLREKAKTEGDEEKAREIAENFIKNKTVICS